MLRIFSTFGMVSALALAGCGPRVEAPTAPPAAVAMAAPLAARQAAVVTLLPGCPRADRGDGPSEVSGLAAAAAAALVPVGVDFLVSAVTDYLKRLETERTASWIATGAGELKPGYGCIVIARGHIGSESVENLQQQGFLSPSDMRAAGLVAPPAFYMEIRIEVAPSAAAGSAPAASQVRLRPQVVQFARTAARRGTDEAKEIGVVLALRASPLPSRPTEATASQGADAVFAFNLGAMRPGQQIAPTPFPVPRLGAQAPVREINQHPFADLAQGGTLPRAGGQLNLAAFVTESGEPGRVLALINDTMERQSAGVRDGLTKALQDAVKQALTPAARQ